MDRWLNRLLGLRGRGLAYPHNYLPQVGHRFLANRTISLKAELATLVNIIDIN